MPATNDAGTRHGVPMIEPREIGRAMHDARAYRHSPADFDLVFGPPKHLRIGPAPRRRHLPRAPSSPAVGAGWLDVAAKAVTIALGILSVYLVVTL